MTHFNQCEATSCPISYLEFVFSHIRSRNLKFFCLASLLRREEEDSL